MYPRTHIHSYMVISLSPVQPQATILPLFAIVLSFVAYIADFWRCVCCNYMTPIRLVCECVWNLRRNHVEFLPKLLAKPCYSLRIWRVVWCTGMVYFKLCNGVAAICLAWWSESTIVCDRLYTRCRLCLNFNLACSCHLTCVQCTECSGIRQDNLLIPVGGGSI